MTMTRVNRCKDAAHAWTTSHHCLFSLNSIFPSLHRLATLHGQSNVANRVATGTGQSRRRGPVFDTPCSMQKEAERQEDGQTNRLTDRQTSCKLEVTPFAMVPCGIFLGVFWAQPRWSLCLVLDVVENFMRFFKCFVPEKRQTALPNNGMESVLSCFMGITRTFTCACQMVARNRIKGRCSFSKRSIHKLSQVDVKGGMLSLWLPSKGLHKTKSFV